MEKIKTISIDRLYSLELDPNNGNIIAAWGSIDLTCEFYVPLPTTLAALPNVNELTRTYNKLFKIDRIEDSKAVFNVVMSFNILTNELGDPLQILTTSDIQSSLEAEYLIYSTRLSYFTPMPFDGIVGTTLDGNSWVYIPPPAPPTP